jgi:hypothetical protein
MCTYVAVSILILSTALCQAFLVALWALTSVTSLWRTIAGLIIGAAYLETLLRLLHNDETLSGLATIMIAITVVTLFVVRAIGGGFVQKVQSELSACPQNHRLRFSIRGLMLFTAAVALVTALAKASRDFPLQERMLVVNSFLSLCLVTAGLVVLWAFLKEGHFLGRGTTDVVLSSTLVLWSLLWFFFAIAFHMHRYQWLNVMLFVSVYLAELLASLVVVRSCGYRFVKRPWPHPGRATDDGSTGDSVLA